MTAKPRARWFGAACVLVVVAVAIAAAVFAHGNGPRSCYVGDPKAPSSAAGPALYAEASEVDGTNPVVVELVQGEPLRQRRKVVVDADAIIGLNGWAVDPAARRGAAVVLARVDKMAPLRADTCGDRSDVAHFYGIPAYARSGFALRLRLTPGVHHVLFSVLGGDGRTLFRDPRELELDVPRPRAVRTTPLVQGAFTRLDDTPVPAAVSAGGPLSHPIGTDLRLDGWMIDRTRAAPAAVRSIDVLVDGRFVGRAAYGSSRPDVADYVHAPGVQNSGFTARVLTDGLSPGRHRLTLRAVVDDGRTTTLAPPLDLDLTPEPAH